MRFAASSTARCLLTDCRAMDKPAHRSRRLCPLRAFRLSSNSRRLGSASALNTSSISAISIHAAVRLHVHHMQLLGCVSMVRRPLSAGWPVKLVVPRCFDGVMLGIAPKERLEVLFEELAELTGQRNAIDGRIVEIAAELERDELIGMTGARSMAALVAWKTGCSPRNAQTIATVAQRLEEFPRCAAGLREGRLSLDQVGIIAEKAGAGSDAHYVTLAEVATVNQLRTALKLEPRPEPDPEPEPWRAPQRSITKTSDEQSCTWKIKLPHVEAATFDAAL